MSFGWVLFALILTVVLTVAVTDYVLAGDGYGYVEYQSSIANGRLEHTIDASINKPSTTHFGWSAFLLSCGGWSEAYVGPTYSPTAWMQVGTAFGIESHPQQSRVGSFVYFGQEGHPLTFVLINEQGGSGSWTKSVGSYNLASQPDEKFCLGGHYQTFYGFGPHAEFGAKPMTLWITYFPKADAGTSAIAGVQLAF